MHCCFDALTNVPGGHTGQTPSKAMPHLFRDRPLLHMPQRLQLFASDTFWYVPFAHGVHSCDDILMKLPGAHVTHTPWNAPPQALRLTPVLHTPQAAQTAWLALGWYSPTGHRSHACAAAPFWTWPGAQSRHSAWPSVGWCLPAGQLTHAEAPVLF